MTRDYPGQAGMAAGLLGFGAAGEVGGRVQDEIGVGVKIGGLDT